MSSKIIPNPIPSVITPKMLEAGPIDLRDWFPPEKFILVVSNPIINHIPGMHKLVIGIKKINGRLVTEQERNYGNGQVYPTPKAPGKVSLKSRTIIDLGNINGVTWLPPEYTKERDRANNLLSINAKAIGQYSKYTGETKIISDAKDIDFTALNKGKKSEDNINSIMEHGIGRAITGAQARAVAKEFSIQSSYPPAELEKEFVGIHLELDLDFNDPRVQNLLIRQATMPRMLLYGNRGSEVESDYEVLEDEEEQKPSPSSKPAQNAPAKEPPKPTQNTPAKEPPKPAQLGLSQVKDEIERLCRKLGKTPLQPLDQMTEPNLRGYLTNLKNQEAANGKGH